MKLTEEKLRSIIREEFKKLDENLGRSRKYSQAAQEAYEAIQNGDEREFLMETRSMLHATGSVMLNGQTITDPNKLEEAMKHVEEARIVLKEIQRS